MGSLDYAQARISARFGDRPDEIAWRRLEHVREFAALLDVARNSAFRVWIGGISEASTLHEIEATLRAHWRAHVAEVAGWVPDEWRGAVQWCAIVPDLAVLAYLALGHPALPWMRDDPLFRDIADTEADACPAALGAGRFAPLAAGWNEPGRIPGLWRQEWERLAPASGDRILLAELGRAMGAHLTAFHDSAVKDGWPLRRALAARLTMLFRKSMLEPTAVFAYLALIALDLERLRGEFLRRAAFPNFSLAA
ncbi:MAG: hypothetical protein ABI569_16590 [Casimicrobiaceae bacterium]